MLLNRVGNFGFNVAFGVGLAVALTLPAAAQVSCQQIGNQTFCSNGQTFQRLGNQTFDNRGNSWQHLGNQTFGSDGSNCMRIGNSIFCN